MSESAPKNGDVYDWSGVRCKVYRVAHDGTWVDILCTSPDGWRWGKRQRLPLPSTFVKVSH